MKITYADTNIIRDKSSEIIDLSNDYNLKMINFFKRLKYFPYTTKEWTGKPAETYAEYVQLDKQQYIDFAEAIKNFGNKIIDAAESIEICIKTSNSGGSYKG